MTTILLIPGVECDVDDSWCDRAEESLTLRNVPAIAWEYERPAWWVLTRGWRNQHRAEALAEKIKRLCPTATHKVSLVAHSNGCDIVCRALRILPSRMVKQVHLIAGACEPDFRKNGLNLAVEQNVVTKIAVYFSGNDRVLRGPGRWFGYGDLGCVGPKYVSSYAMPDVERVRDDSQTHGSWLSGGAMARILEAVTA